MSAHTRNEEWLDSNEGFDVHLHHVDGFLVVTAIGNDDIGELLGRFDEFIVHGFEHVAVFVDKHVESMSSLGYVAAEDTKEALVRTCVNEYLQVHEVAKILVVESHDAFNDYHFLGFDLDGLGQTRAGNIRISRLLYRPTLSQLFYLMSQERPFECVGMVEIGALRVADPTGRCSMSPEE